jgi:hypothetical protein
MYMIGPHYMKANSEREIPIPLLSTSAHEEQEFRTVQNWFVNE